MKQIKLLENYCNFESEFDVYVLFGIARKKDNEGITNSKEVVFREIIKSKDNIAKKYTKLIAQCKNYTNQDGKKLNFYIYCSVNARDVRKGYIAFKNKMLAYEKEIMYGVSCSNQLKRVDAIWLSAIMEPASRAKHRRFLVDIDTKDKNYINQISNELNHHIFPIDITKTETKNGWHYIIPPFDKSNFPKLIDVEIKTDAMFFLDHIEGGNKNESMR